MRTRSVLLLCAALSLAAVPLVGHHSAATAQEAAEEPSTPLQLEGAWQLTISHARGRAIVEQAIQRAVQQMSIVVRGIAESELRNKTPLNDFIEVSFPANQIEVRFDRRRTYRTPEGQAREFPSPAGGNMRVTQSFRRGRLEQVFSTDMGSRRNIYVLAPDGSLRVTTLQQGSPIVMPAPVRFTVVYRRGS